MTPHASGDDVAALFAFESVSVTQDATTILSEVSATVPPTGITALVGPSGAGKSTMLRLCNRLEVPTSGRVRFRGRDVAEVDPLALRRRVGMVFQQPALFGGSIRDNLAVARPDGDAERFAQALRDAALDPGLLDRPAEELSGGEAQRACLARTLVTDPEVLLLDEPTAALDTSPRRAFERLAVDLARGQMPMLWVTHDLEQLYRVADHALALFEGSLVYQGDPEGLHDVEELTDFMTGGED